MTPIPIVAREGGTTWQIPVANIKGLLVHHNHPSGLPTDVAVLIDGRWVNIGGRRYPEWNPALPTSPQYEQGEGADIIAIYDSVAANINGFTYGEIARLRTP